MTRERIRPQEWLERLVEIDTTSRNSNLGFIEIVRDYLLHLGLAPRLTFSEDRAKANLLCSIPDMHGGVSGGLVFSGHTDVVPVDGQLWETDPFKLTQVGQRLYGRGTSDMKGFIAVVLSTLPAFLTSRISSAFHLALSFDEEIGCLGAPLMLQDLAEQGIKPRGCIVGEPTDMRMVAGHKGFSAHRCTVTGRNAHSSLPMAGVNAVEYAAELILFIRTLSDTLRTEGLQDTAFDVPYSSVQTATVRGGEAVNVVPGSCRFDFSIRNLPEIDPDEVLAQVRDFAERIVLPQMKTRGAEVDITLDTLARVPGLIADPGNEFFTMMRQLFRDDTVRKVAYGSEAGLFQRAGVSTVVCGPGDIARAHRANEYIEVGELGACEDFIVSLMQKLT
jgi:acetylornithine deacetylase